ncbi:Uncharacterized conserved protein, putative [Trypanosoma equiperdum]|uniref:FPL domain-containing protein n=2 Tax=Trypanozoon TaxID=39700 RepID=Q38DZ2_TRYB2|nr:hypothetical protein, conserved [Trypanosoma brucei brucei TREU927]EAN76978.1 hypothetical protein, conserved [Trypanosoma brucei brucei TREU927]SCU68633.1 Uncharacterised conserved protein, putative [Trypanosoma equiperdum]
MQKAKNQSYEKFSQENVSRLCMALKTTDESQAFTTNNISEILRELAQAIIWGDKKNNASFDVFLELDMITTLESIVTNVESPSNVKAEVLRFVTLMLHNLTMKENVYYICSKNHLNKMISIDLNENDDELLSVYVSFLKSLALRCDETTVQFFFIRQLGVFPLFDYAAKLINTSDRMARGAARQVVISVARLQSTFLTSFMEKALPDILRIISKHVWLEIGILSEAVNRYHDAVGDADDATPLPTVDAIRSLTEDVLDDLLYVNDLFAVSSTVVERELRPALVTGIIDPLLALIEAPMKSSTVTRSAFAPVMQPALALCVITRWLLLGKENRIHQVLFDGLLGPKGSDPAECLLGRILSKGCMHCLSAGVVLLGAIVNVGAFNERGNMSDERLCNEIGTADRISNRDDNEVEVSPSKKQLDGDKDPAECCMGTAVDALPSYETFLRDVKSSMGSTAHREPWCICLVGALYRFITCSLLTRLSAFELSLNLLKTFVPESRERRTVSVALASLCEGVLRRRLLAYYDTLIRRKDCRSDENSGNRGLLMANKDCFRSACETLFLEMERVCNGAEPRVEYSFDKLGREVALLLPLLPYGGYSSTERLCCQRQLTSHPQRLADVQGVIGDLVSYHHRAAHSPTEQKDREFMMWASVRRMLYDTMQQEDSFILRLRKYGVQHRVGASVGRLSSTTTRFRCELVKVAVPPGKASKVVPIGKPMNMLLLETEIIFVEPRDMESTSAADIVNEPVLFPMPTVYVQAALSRTPFSVVFTYFHPDNPMRLHVAFRHSKVAQSVINTTNERSAYCRCHGAALVCGALNAEPPH